MTKLFKRSHLAESGKAVKFAALPADLALPKQLREGDGRLGSLHFNSVFYGIDWNIKE
jgi:hypothetical protein